MEGKMMQQTSLRVWDTEVKAARGKNQIKVYNVLKEHSALCNRQLASLLDWPINSVTPRVQELREADMVEEAFRGKDPQTNRTVIYWQVVR